MTKKWQNGIMQKRGVFMIQTVKGKIELRDVFACFPPFPYEIWTAAQLATSDFVGHSLFGLYSLYGFKLMFDCIRIGVTYVLFFPFRESLIFFFTSSVLN